MQILTIGKTQKAVLGLSLEGVVVVLPSGKPRRVLIPWGNIRQVSYADE